MGLNTFFTKPSAKFSAGALLVAGVVAGVVSWSLFHQAVDYTSEEAFCVSCHSMQQPLEELKQTTHWSNKSGLSASCSDCHLPHETGAKYVRKVQAVGELVAEMQGKLDSQEAFEQHRQAMAEREWARMAANGSAECKTCHSYERMDFDKMSENAQRAMHPAAEKDQSCIDCHKGVAHHLPNTAKADKTTTSSHFDQFVQKSLTQGKTYYTKATADLFLDENLSQAIGQLETAVPVNLVQTSEKADLVELTMWRKNKGFGRIWYFDFGKNITDAVLSKEFMANEPKFSVLESREDPITGLEWQKVQLQAWIGKDQLLDDVAPIWASAESQYKTQCSICHKQPDVAHFDSNSWIGLFNGMVGFTNMDKQTAKEVLRYLQLHAADTEQANH